MTEIEVEITLSNGKKITLTYTDKKLSREDLFEEIIGYETGVCWECNENEEDVIFESFALLD